MRSCRKFGNFATPRESAEASPAEEKLARRLRHARAGGQLSPEQKAELQALARRQKAELQRGQKTEELLQQLRDFGRYPKEYAGRSFAERNLAQ